MLSLPTLWRNKIDEELDAGLRREGIRHVHLIDTAVASDNVGDEVIVEAARRHLGPRLAGCYVTTSAGHEGLGPLGRRWVASADLVILLGTNALSPRYKVGRRFIWRVRPGDIPLMAGKLVLFGVGANAPFERIDGKQRQFLSRMLSPAHLHSVRDARAQAIVEAVGHRALNTSCPTLWQIANLDLPTRKADTVCFTLTKHKPDPLDRLFVDALLGSYRRVVFFPQQPRDLGYLREVCGSNRIEVLAPNLRAYDQFVEQTDTDVIGTRLHGTIRGLQHGRRGLAVQIDKRAEDIGRETGLPTLARSQIHSLPHWINGTAKTALKLPEANIAAFLQQL